MPDELHLHIHLTDPIKVVHTADPVLTTLINSIKEDIAKMSTSITDALAELQADVTEETTVNQSAITLINGIPALISAAVAAAQAAGATPAQLQSFTDLNAQIKANSTALATAISTNTPPSP